MKTLFLICAAMGGTLLLLQFLAGLVGFGGDESGDADGDVSVDVDHGDAGHVDAGHGDAGGGDVDHSDGHPSNSSTATNVLFSVLSFKSIMTAITFFGIGGMAAVSYQLDDLRAFGIAFACGIIALYAIGMLMRLMFSLKADGTIRIDRTIGKTGTVYLKIPGHRVGMGKVTLTVQNRSVEYQAITAEGDLPTGSRIVVVGVHRPDTLEVALAPSTLETTSPEKPSHV